MRAVRWISAAVLLGVMLARLVWPSAGGVPHGSQPVSSDAAPAAGSATLSPAPPGARTSASAREPPEPGDGLAPCEIRVTTFGAAPRDVEITRVWQAETVDLAPGVARVRARPGTSLGLDLRGAAVGNLPIDVPNPVPPRIDVRVPAPEDPRLADPVLLVVDAASGRALPAALLDPGARAPDAGPIRADAEGRIRVPAALVERLRTYSPVGGEAIVAEPDHVPRSLNLLFPLGVNHATAADWRAWDSAGAMPLRLERLSPGDRPVPRRSLRITGGDGSPTAGRLVLMRTVGSDVLMVPPFPARTDDSGVAEVVAPSVAAYDVYDGACLVGTFVLSWDGATAGGAREIRVPEAVRVHVIVRGLAEPKPVVWLRGPDVVSLEPDERTGWSRVDGEVGPGWRAFGRSEGSVVQMSDGLPAEGDLLLPRDRPVPMQIAGRETVLRVDAPRTIEIDWATLPAPSKEPGSVSWSLTREGLDEIPGVRPAGPRAGGGAK